MKKTYKIEVDCANCAAKIEEAIKKVEGTNNISVNYMTQKMIVDYADNADEKEVLKKITKIAKKIEDEFEIL